MEDIPHHLESFLKKLEKDHIIKINIEKGFQVVQFDYFQKYLNNYTPKNAAEESILNYVKTNRASNFFWFEDFKPFLEEESTFISSGEKDLDPKKKKKADPSGGSPVSTADLGGRASEEGIDKKRGGGTAGNLLIEPKEGVGGAYQWLEEIWISEEERIHFESMKCRLDPEGDLFEALEEYLSPRYSYGHATPITNEGRVRLGISFSVQMHKNGLIRLHLADRNQRDPEKFCEDFLNFFSKGLDHGQLTRFLTSLYRERLEEPVFIHIANEIGPKKAVDENLKGAAVQITFHMNRKGVKTFSAFIDYSHKEEPEIECTGDSDVVVPFQRLLTNRLSKSLEYIGNVEDIRDSSRKTLLNTEECLGFSGDILQRVIQVQGELEGFSEQAVVVGVERYEELKRLLDVMQVELKDRLITLEQELKGDSQQMRYAFAQSFTELVNKYGGLIEKLLNLDNNLTMSVSHARKELENLLILKFNEYLQEHQKSLDDHSEIKAHLVELKQGMSTLEASLKMFIRAQFEGLKGSVKNWLYLVFRKLETSERATIKELQALTKVPRTTLLYYLKKLQGHGYVYAETDLTDRSSPGRPPKLYQFTTKCKNKLNQIKEYNKNE